MKAKVLVAIDIQREYITDGRPFNIQSIGSSLKNAKTVLNFARSHGWEVLHMRHLQQGSIFNQESEFSFFVEGFEPKQGGVSLSKGDFSCY